MTQIRLPWARAAGTTSSNDNVSAKTLMPINGQVPYALSPAAALFILLSNHTRGRLLSMQRHWSIKCPQKQVACVLANQMTISPANAPTVPMPLTDCAMVAGQQGNFLSKCTRGVASSDNYWVFSLSPE